MRLPWLRDCPKGAFLYLGLGSHHHRFHLDDVKESLTQKYTITEVNIPPDSLFIGHGYVQDDAAAWCGKYCLRYHINLIPQNGQLKDAIAFAFNNTLGIEATSDKARRKIILA